MADEGEMKVGSEWRETRKMFGKEATEHFEVMELHKPNKIVLRVDGTKGTTGKGEYTFTYTLRTIEKHTEVTLLGEIKGLTGFAKFMSKLIVGAFKKGCEKDLHLLKKNLRSKREHELNNL